MTKALQTIQSEYWGKVRGYLENGTVHLNLGDIAACLNFIKPDGTVQTRTLNRLLEDSGYTKKFNPNDYVPEGVFYYLAIKSNSPNADGFHRWLSFDVVPSIRATGSYSVKAKQPALPSTTELRQRAIDTRKSATSVYQSYIDYAIFQGDSRARKRTYKEYSNFIYSKLSTLANRAAGIPNGGRPVADDEQQMKVKMAENLIGSVILNGMADSKHFATIESQIAVGLDNLRKYFEPNWPMLTA